MSDQRQTIPRVRSSHPTLASRLSIRSTTPSLDTLTMSASTDTITVYFGELEIPVNVREERIRTFRHLKVPSPSRLLCPDLPTQQSHPPSLFLFLFSSFPFPLPPSRPQHHLQAHPQTRDLTRDVFFTSSSSAADSRVPKLEMDAEIHPSQHSRIWAENSTFPVVVRDGDIVAEFIVDGLTTIDEIKDKFLKRFPMLGEIGDLSHRGRRVDGRDRLQDVGIKCASCFQFLSSLLLFLFP